MTDRKCERVGGTRQNTYTLHLVLHGEKVVRTERKPSLNLENDSAHRTRISQEILLLTDQGKDYCFLRWLIIIFRTTI